MLTACDVKRPEAVESALLAISRLNDGVQALLFDPNKLAATYPASMILRPPKFQRLLRRDGRQAREWRGMAP